MDLILLPPRTWIMGVHHCIQYWGSNPELPACSASACQLSYILVLVLFLVLKVGTCTLCTHSITSLSILSLSHTPAETRAWTILNAQTKQLRLPFPRQMLSGQCREAQFSTALFSRKAQNLVIFSCLLGSAIKYSLTAFSSFQV